METDQTVYSCCACGMSCHAIDIYAPSGCLFPKEAHETAVRRKIPEPVEPEWSVDELLSKLLLHKEVS